MNIESQFQHAMHASGIKSDAQVIADGKLHRFHIDDKDRKVFVGKLCKLRF